MNVSKRNKNVNEEKRKKKKENKKKKGKRKEKENEEKTKLKMVFFQLSCHSFMPFLNDDTNFEICKLKIKKK